MKNFLSRILLVAIAVPGLYVLTVFLPQLGHIGVFLVDLGFSAACGVEIARMFASRNFEISIPFSALLSALPSALLWILLRFLSPGDAGLAFLPGILIIALAAFSPFALVRTPEEASKVLTVASVRIFPLLYPGLFSSVIVLIADYPGAGTQAILWFALLVFGNDSMAWAIGVLFGRHRGIVPISPNKSLEGFVGAFAGSMAAAFMGPVLFPGVVREAPASLALLGLIVGISVIIGDLFESALKRSAGFKDSGTMIPGRGGFLDSFDSILFAAPIYYVAVRVLDLI
jgi:phosphatidate cytidylyltransferase